MEPPRVDETVPDSSPADAVRAVAEEKAGSVALRHLGTPRVILAADTMLVIDNQLFGKPRDSADACRMLGTLQGRTHEVLTSYSLVDCLTDHRLSKVIRVTVGMRPLSVKAIEAYVASGESLDKAGAYAIQGRGATLIERVSGDFYAVVGLPLCDLARSLAEFGVSANTAS